MSQNLGETIPIRRVKRRLRKERAAILVAIFLLIVTGITYVIDYGQDKTGLPIYQVYQVQLSA